MLARVAESLYWFGRNLERAEHCTRFLKVQYYSTLDAPMLQNRDFTLRSILFMSGSDFDTEFVPTELEVLRKVIFDYNNASSIFSIIRNGRENARSIRNAISSELWEAINKWYLFSKNYKVHQFDAGKIHEFSDIMFSHIAMIKSNVSNSMLHNDVWHFLNLGKFIECTLQVIRIMRSKISDWSILSDNGVNKALMTYQWTIMLKSLEAFDAHNNYNKGHRSQGSIFEFTVGNAVFPRSINSTLSKIAFHLERVSLRPEEYPEVARNLEMIIDDNEEFKDYKDEEKVVEYLENANISMSNLHNQISNMYFN